MSDTIQRQLAGLQKMTTGELVRRYAELHGQQCRTRHRAYLIRKIAWRIQANAEGDLSDRARRRAAELANDAEVRVMAPKSLVSPPQGGDPITTTRSYTPSKFRDPRLPTPGSAIWVCLPDRYDDGGFSGGSMERPALERLLADIDAGRIDCVVVYKVDRLSRSLMDFARIMQTFERSNVSFVSVTQQFNTTSSMGRLTLHILLSFAQFEREIIGERIRDKIAAQKKKGKWAGGAPVLGYDVDREGGSPRLVVNAKEAGRVREMFQLYLDKGSLQPVATELARRQWPNKRRVTSKGIIKGGRPFDKSTLHVLLTNPILAGRIVHKGNTYQGEHEAIVTPELFDKVQQLMRYNGRTGGIETRNRYGALLRGLLRCKHCDATMTHTFTGGRGKPFYRYYRCVQAIKRGAHVCPATTVPAAEMERFVVDEIRALGQDRGLLDRVLSEARVAADAEIAALRKEQQELSAELPRREQELKELVRNGGTGRSVTDRLATVHERTSHVRQRLPIIKRRLEELETEVITRDESRAALSDFEGVWNNLIPREQARLLMLVFSSVEYDATAGTVSVTFRPTGIAALCRRQAEEAA